MPVHLKPPLCRRRSLENMCEFSGMLSTRAEAPGSFCTSSALCLKGEGSYLSGWCSQSSAEGAVSEVLSSWDMPTSRWSSFVLPKPAKLGERPPHSLLQGKVRTAAVSLRVSWNCVITLQQGWRGGMDKRRRREGQRRMWAGAEIDNYENATKPHILYAN